MAQRTELFIRNKNKKIESAREEQKDKATEGCTFEPKLCKPPKMPKDVSQVNRSRHNHSLSNISNQSINKRESVNSYSQIHEKK